MKSLTPHQSKAAASEPNTCVLDVRTPLEFEEMHIAGSRHIPVDELAGCCDQLDPSQRYLLICRSGKRAEKAHRILEENGFNDLCILEGGVLAWEEGKLPLNRKELKVLPLMRQVQLVIGVLALTGSVLAMVVNPWFALIPAFLGAGLTMAGATGWCGLALLLARMPWNQKSGCPGGASCTLA